MIKQKRLKFLEPASFFRSVVSFITLTAFTFSSISFPPAWAAAEENFSQITVKIPQDAASIKVPKSAGKIEEVFKGERPETVILIRDAHSIPDAQRNIQKLIAHFQQKYGFNLTLLEGAAGELDPTLFRSFPDREKLQAVLEDYFDRGELTGGVAAAILNPGRARYFGAEDWKLYEEGVDLYLAAMEKEPVLLEKLRAEEAALKARKQQAYSDKLLQIDQALEGFEENKTDFISVLKMLAAVKRPEAGTDLALVLEESEQPETEENLDIEVKQAAVKFIKHLESQRPSARNQEILKALRLKQQDFVTQQVSAQDFALALQELASGTSYEFDFSEGLSRGASRQRMMRDMEGTRFFEDFQKYTDGIKSSLFRGPEERLLDQESRRLMVLGKLIRLEINREDWAFLKTFAAGGNTPIAFEDLKAHIAFYENSEDRDRALFERIAGAMKMEKSRGSLFVGGGFHSEGLMKQLRESGISYVLVMPQISAIPDAGVYQEHMKGKVSWSSYLRNENGRVNLYAAFARGTRDRLLENPAPGSSGPALLKEWRDQIIRDLAARKKIERTAEYTPVLDEKIPGAAFPAGNA